MKFLEKIGFGVPVSFFSRVHRSHRNPKAPFSQNDHLPHFSHTSKISHTLKGTKWNYHDDDIGDDDVDCCDQW